MTHDRPYDSRLAFIECEDYEAGKFTPVSFDPVFKWKITTSRFIESSSRLSRLIVFETTSLHGYKLVVESGPYAYGWFSAQCRGLGLVSAWLDTNDPEDALYRTERRFKNWANQQIEFYSKFAGLYE